MIVTSTEAQNNFGQYLKFAQYEDIVISRNGRNIAVIKSYKDKETSGFSVAEVAEQYLAKPEKISYDDFIKMSNDSDNRYEYIDGEVYLLASPSYDHQRIVTEIIVLLYNILKSKKCRPVTAPFDVTLYKNKYDINVVQPDILVICDMENVNERGRYTGIPTLVIEILSPDTRSKDMIKKLNLYTLCCIGEYWIINPFNKEIYIYNYCNKEIEQYRVFKNGEQAVSVIIEGLKIDLGQIFI